MKRSIFIFFLLLALSAFTRLFGATSDSLLQVIERAKEDTNKVKLLLESAWSEKFSNPESMLASIQKANNLSFILKYKAGMAKSERYFGVYYYLTDDYPEALSHLVKAEEYLLEISPSEELANLYNTYGLIYSKLGDEISALKYYYKCLDANRDIANEDGIASAMINIASIHYNKEEYEDAVELWEKALTIKLKDKNYNGIAIIYGNLGVLFEKKGKPEKAIKYQLKSLDVYEKHLDSKSGVAITYNNLGTAYMSDGQIGDALYYFDEALKIYSDIESYFGLAMVHNNLADALRKDKKYEPAKRHSNRALKIAKKHGIPGEIKIAYQELSLIAEAKQEYDSALSYYKQYISMRDSLWNEDEAAEIEKIHTLNKIEVKNAERKAALKFQEMQEKKIKVMQYLGFIALFALFVLFMDKTAVVVFPALVKELLVYINVILSLAFVTMMLFLKSQAFLEFSLFLQVVILVTLMAFAFLYLVALKRFFTGTLKI